MLVLDNIVYCVNAHENILNSIGFEIDEGEFVGLVSPSGTGKSTLLRCISGLIKPTSGYIRLNGKDITNSSIAKRSISFMQQGFPLYEHLTVWKNVVITQGKDQTLTLKYIHEDALNLLDKVGISEDFFQRLPQTLSGGEAQRVALCKALIQPSKLLLLDEPFSNLDKSLRRELGDMVRQRAKKRGQSVLFVSHDESDVLFLSDRVCIMDNGRILQYDNVHNLKKSPLHQKVASFALEAGLQTLPLDLINEKQLKLIQNHFGELVNLSIQVGWRPDFSTLIFNSDIEPDISHYLTFSVEIERTVPTVGGQFIQLSIKEIKFNYSLIIWHFEPNHTSNKLVKKTSLIIRKESLFLIGRDGKIIHN